MNSANSIMRIGGIVGTIAGLWMLFSPIIALLKFIPLVGWLLGAIVSFAAFLFALVVGLTLASLTIAIAWLVFRPLIGGTMLLLMCVGLYFIFIFPAGKETADAGSDTTTTDTTTPTS